MAQVRGVHSKTVTPSEVSFSTSFDSFSTRRGFFTHAAAMLSMALLPPLGSHGEEAISPMGAIEARSLSKFGEKFLQEKLPYFTAEGTPLRSALGRSGLRSIRECAEKLGRSKVVIMLTGEADLASGTVCPHVMRAVPTFGEFAKACPDTLFVLAHNCIPASAQRFSQAYRKSLGDVLHISDPDVHTVQLNPEERAQGAGSKGKESHYFTTTFFVLTAISANTKVITHSANPVLYFTPEILRDSARYLGAQNLEWVPQQSPMNAARGCAIGVCSHSSRDRQ